MWLTMVWQITLQIPWAWKIGPSYSSERAHFLDLLTSQNYPEYTVFCGDAGFVGHDFWRAINDRGHHFLCRVGGNVRLLKHLGHARGRNGIVYCWPDAAVKKKLPPLILRLLRFRDGRGDVSDRQLQTQKQKAKPQLSTTQGRTIKRNTSANYARFRS
jgi:hypothetical protein